MDKAPGKIWGGYCLIRESLVIWIHEAKDDIEYKEVKKTKQLTDYKFYCFNGEPRFLYVSRGLEDHSSAELSYLSINWESVEFDRTDFSSFSKIPSKPEKFSEMISIARKLSEKLCFLRVDLYEINHALYFSELTFSPGSGFTPFEPDKWDEIVGLWLALPDNKVIGTNQ